MVPKATGLMKHQALLKGICQAAGQNNVQTFDVDSIKILTCLKNLYNKRRWQMPARLEFILIQL